jgi:16S rRNA G527 N7-methylase RsmG
VVAQVHLTPKLAAAWGPTFDLVLSRAALPLADLIAVAAPLLKPGGRVLALKGPNLREGELAQAQAQAGRLGLAPLQLWRYCLPVTGEPRLAVQGTGPPG